MASRRTGRRTAGVETEIVQVLQAFEDGWNRHDMEACFSSYATDADFVNVLGAWWRGRGEIVREHAERHRNVFRESTLRTTQVAIRFLTPRIAIVHMGWELTGARTPEGNDIPIRRGVMTKTMSRREGQWRVEAAQNTDVVARTG
jgi:uncharacterized protein (TIGR02246 family)